ncbi:hypothetical protein D3C85_1068720 [compost metagenome]
MRQVASSKVQVLVDGIGNDQHVGQTQAVQLAQQSLGFRCIDSKVFNHNQALLTHELGEDGAHGCAVHLLVELLGVILRLGSESGTTGAPDGATDGASTSTTSALLTPRLLATTGNFGTGLLRASALTATGHVGDDSLVNQGLVELTAKSALADFDSLSAIYIQLHLSFPS